ncbi:MAG: hypothetical protein II046_07695 [Clostridiales bacterium]|nr:hypothetical protein [Clostridiales bacterium]
MDIGAIIKNKKIKKNSGDKMETIQMKKRIKELMKKYGFKNTGDFFHKHVNDNFVIVVFSLR